MATIRVEAYDRECNAVGVLEFSLMEYSEWLMSAKAEGYRIYDSGVWFSLRKPTGVDANGETKFGKIHFLISKEQ